MRKNMKLTGLAVCLTCCAGFINAQEASIYLALRY